MQGHRSPGGLQSFVPTHSATRNCFRTPVRLRSALTIRYTASKQLAHGMPQRNQPEIHKTAFLGGAGVNVTTPNSRPNWQAKLPTNFKDAWPSKKFATNPDQTGGDEVCDESAEIKVALISFRFSFACHRG